jgi:hypothetical protein
LWEGRSAPRLTSFDLAPKVAPRGGPPTGRRVRCADHSLSRADVAEMMIDAASGAFLWEGRSAPRPTRLGLAPKVAPRGGPPTGRRVRCADHSLSRADVAEMMIDAASGAFLWEGRSAPRPTRLALAQEVAPRGGPPTGRRVRCADHSLSRADVAEMMIDAASGAFLWEGRSAPRPTCLGPCPEGRPARRASHRLGGPHTGFGLICRAV